MQQFKYSLFSGTGNTFAIVEGSVPKDTAIIMCLDLDVDGLLCLSGSSVCDAFMHIINRDGSEASMCGNGLRCVLKYLSKKIGQKSISVETLAGIYSGSVEDHLVTASMSRVFWDIKLDINVALSRSSEVVSYINSGVPHVVLFKNNISSIDVVSIGREIRHHEKFAPAGTNVNFVSGVKEIGSELLIRTYERGVENETLSCGTGIVAAALLSSKLYGIQSPIRFKTKGKEILTVSFDYNWSKVLLTGAVSQGKEGVFVLQTAAHCATL